jgi:hypothetical protein
VVNEGGTLLLLYICVAAIGWGGNRLAERRLRNARAALFHFQGGDADGD